MNKLLTTLVVLCLTQAVGFSQKHYGELLDSLQTELTHAKGDSTKLNLLVTMLTEYITYKPKEGLTYKDTALELAKKTNSEINIARVKDKIGRLYWQTGKFDEAYRYHFDALDIYVKAGDKHAEANVLIWIGQDFLNDNKYAEAGKYLLKALKVSEDAGDKKAMARTYDKLIALYEDQGNIAEASKAMYTHLKINEELGDKAGIAHATSLLGANFQTLGNNDEALKYFKRSLQMNVEAGDKLGQTYSYLYIGGLFLSMNNINEAKNWYSTGQKIADKMENGWLVQSMFNRAMGNVNQAAGDYNEALHYYLITAEELKQGASHYALASVYSEIGIIYTKLKKYHLARKSFDDAMALCRELNTKVPLRDYYKGMHLLDSATGNWDDAYSHYKNYIIIRDSTFNKETLKKLVATQIQYETDKKEAVAKSEQEKKDVMAQEEIKRQLNIRNSALGVLALVLLFSVVVYRQRNKIAGEKKRSDQLVTDKELLLREIHHRVKNNLEVVSSLLALQSAQINDPTTKEAMQDGQNRVHSIGIVHQKLYQGENLGSIEMKDYFLNLSESILDSFGAEGRVTVEFAMEKLNVDIDTAVPLGLIVNELLTNTLKYAFPNDQNGSVRIKLEKQASGTLHLEVSDNGVGKSGVVHGTGFGGQLISLLTRQLNGSMKEEIKNGTSIFFDFKLDKVAQQIIPGK